MYFFKYICFPRFDGLPSNLTAGKLFLRQIGIAWEIPISQARCLSNVAYFQRNLGGKPICNSCLETVHNWIHSGRVIAVRTNVAAVFLINYMESGKAWCAHFWNEAFVRQICFLLRRKSCSHSLSSLMSLTCITPPSLWSYYWKHHSNTTGDQNGQYGPFFWKADQFQRVYNQMSVVNTLFYSTILIHSAVLQITLSIIKYTFKMLLLYLKVLRDSIHYLLLYTLLTLLQLFKLFAAVNR